MKGMKISGKFLQFSELTAIMPEFMQNETKKIVLNVLTHHFGAHKVKMHADIEVSCFTEEGVDAIIASLSEAQKIGTEGEFIKVSHLLIQRTHFPRSM